jgi:hypothetical protein
MRRGVSQTAVSSGDLCEAEGTLYSIGSVCLERCDCAYCDALRNETKVLWLGMAYTDTDTTTIESIVDLNAKGELTDAEGRDAADASCRSDQQRHLHIGQRAATVELGLIDTSRRISQSWACLHYQAYLIGTYRPI